MKSESRIISILVISIVLLFLAGCGTFEEKQSSAQLRWEKSTATIKLSVAQDYFERSQYQKSEKALTQCITADSNIADAYILFGKLRLVEDDTTRAMEMFTKAIEIEPRNHNAYYLLAVTSQQTGDFDSAENFYKQALQYDGKNTKYVKALGQLYTQQEKFTQAESFYKYYIKKLPAGSGLYSTVARLEMQQGKYDIAVKYYKQAMLLDSDNSALKEALGYCYISADNWKAASEIFEQLVDDSPADPKRNNQYLKMLSLCDMHSGQYSKAAANFDKLSVSERNNPEFWLQMGHALLASDSVDSALVCAQRALALKPGWSQAIALKGSAQYLNADYMAALDSFQNIINENQQDAFAWLMLGRCYDKLNNKEKAKQSYERSLKINPDNKLAMKYVANI